MNRAVLACAVAASMLLAGCGARTSLETAAGRGVDAGPVTFDAAVGDAGCLGSGGGPVVLASGVGFASDVALDDAYAYWVEPGTYGAADGLVKRVSLCGGTVETLASGEGNPAGLVVDATDVYWTRDPSHHGKATIVRVAKVGGTPTVVTTAFDPAGPLVERGGFLYWTASDAVNTVGRIPLAGGPEEVVVPGYGLTAGLAVDATSVYWSLPFYGTGTIESAPIAGGAVTTLASGRNSPRTVVVDATSVFWAEAADDTGGPGSVARVPKGGGAVVLVATGEAVPRGLALDATSIYWTHTPDLSAVMAAPLGGGALTTLASEPTAPGAIAADGTRVVWADDGYPDGGVLRGLAR